MEILEFLGQLLVDDDHDDDEEASQLNPGTASVHLELWSNAITLLVLIELFSSFPKWVTLGHSFLSAAKHSEDWWSHSILGLVWNLMCMSHYSESSHNSRPTELNINSNRHEMPVQYLQHWHHIINTCHISPSASLSGGLISVPLCDLVMITFGDLVRVSLCSSSSGTMFKWLRFLYISPEGILTIYDLGDAAVEITFPGWVDSLT